MPIKELSIDLETYCEVDLRKSGVYRYAEDDSFEILLLAVSVDNGPVRVYDITKKNFLIKSYKHWWMTPLLSGLLMPPLNAYAYLTG